MRKRYYQDLIVKHLTSIVRQEQSPERIDTYIDLIRILLKPFPLAYKDYTNRIATITKDRDNSLKHTEHSIEAHLVHRKFWEKSIVEIYNILGHNKLLPNNMTNPNTPNDPHYSKKNNNKYQKGYFHFEQPGRSQIK